MQSLYFVIQLVKRRVAIFILHAKLKLVHGKFCGITHYACICIARYVPEYFGINQQGKLIHSLKLQATAKSFDVGFYIYGPEYIAAAEFARYAAP